jgi:hypothetical protein
MSVRARLPRLGVLDIFAAIIASHPAAILSQRRKRSAPVHHDATLALLPPHLRDDLGLPPIPPEEPEHPGLARARLHGRNWS